MGFSDIKESLNKVGNVSEAKVPRTDRDITGVTGLDSNLDNGGTKGGAYEILKERWFSSPPYGFRFLTRDGQKRFFFLPIAPQNLTITTHYATNVIATLYGTVEEHSEQRYFDIVIDGTTGMAPKYMHLLEDVTIPNSEGATLAGKTGNAMEGTRSAGRKRYGDSSDVNKWSINANLTGGLAPVTMSIANVIAANTKDLVNGGKEKTFNKTGLYIDQTGYLAFHRLYKFFLMYKADACGIDTYKGTNEISTDSRIPAKSEQSTHPLTFLNYKDNNEYDCSIQRFVLRRDANNPMLYYYNIVLRAYNIRQVSAQIALPSDIVASMLGDLGLTGVSSGTILTWIKQKADLARSIAGAAIGGINVLGR